MSLNNFKTFFNWFSEIREAQRFYPQHTITMESIWNDLRNWDGSNVITEQTDGALSKDYVISLLRRRYETIKNRRNGRFSGFSESLNAIASMEEKDLIVSMTYAQLRDQQIIWLFTDQMGKLVVVITITLS